MTKIEQAIEKAVKYGRREGENVTLCWYCGPVEEGARPRLNKRSEIVSEKLSWGVI